MAGTPGPPLNPNDPRAGDPTNPVTWMIILGVIVAVIVIGGITYVNSGKGLTPTNNVARTSPTPSTGSAPTGSYRIIFQGEATGHVEVPDNHQAYAGQDTKAKWDLVYNYGTGQSDEPDPTQSKVTGSGEYKVRSGDSACKASSVIYRPNVSLLKRVGEGDTFSLTPPIAGDLSGVPCNVVPKGDPFYLAWNAACPGGSGTPGVKPNDADCSSLPFFYSVKFTIKDGQKGTVVIDIPLRVFNHTATGLAGSVTGMKSQHSWSGKITVSAL